MNGKLNFHFILIMGILLLFADHSFTENTKGKTPNIIYILADDLGYGDIAILNPDSKIPTPNLDTFAKQGIIFTDAHSGSAVCSPTRYGILTGRYAWRTHLQQGVLWSYEQSLIDKDRLTVPGYLKNKGYHTACIGKWHLGWDWPAKDGTPLKVTGSEFGWNIDFNHPIKNGPLSRGFDYYFGVDVPNFPPYCFIENDRTIGIPTVEKPAAMYGVPGIMLTGWSLEPILPELEERAVRYIEERSKTGQPFFLYFPLTAPHTPIAPGADFRGKSRAGAYGDFVYQIDHIIGRIVDVLEKNGIDSNTLIIFTSDNGSPGRDGTHMEGAVNSLQKYGHYPSYIFRGTKSDIWEGGHRIPFFARWPGKILPGSKSDETICLTDFFATTAAIFDEKLPDNAGEDSYNIISAMLGEYYKKPIREATVHHSNDGSFAIRKGSWKLALCPGSGGWSLSAEKAMIEKKPMLQLYNLDIDIHEQNNIYAQYPDTAHALIKLLEKYVAEGRSTPGRSQYNEVNPDIWQPMRVRETIYDTSIVNHKGIGANLRLENEVRVQYNTKGISALTDGIRATTAYDDGYWVGFEEKDIDLVVDLTRVQLINEMKVGTLQDQNSWIFLPEKIKFSVSTDGLVYTDLKRITTEAGEQNNKKLIRNFEVRNINSKVQYIKIKVKSIGVCPDWHKGAGGKAWVFMDEIIVK